MIRRRLLHALTALTVAVAGGALAAPGTGQAYGLRSLVASTWAWTDSARPHTAFVDQKTNAPVGRWVDAEEEAHISRFYFSYDLSGLRGRVLHEAGFYVQEKKVTDCTRSAPVELWRTSGITANTSWRTPPTELEKVADLPTGEIGQCPGGYLTRDVTETLRAALDRGETSVTFELRIAEASEKDKDLSRWLWYRPALNIWDNTRPTIGEVAQFPEKTCGTLAEPTPVNGNSTSFAAKVTDPDQNDWPRVTFAAWPVDDPDQRREQGGSSYSRESFRTAWDTSGYPHGTVVAWAARGEDGYDRSEWSAPCHIRVDREAPAQAPEVSSTDYPAGREWPGSGGVGVPGTFRFDAGGDPDVTRYRYYDSSIGTTFWVGAPAPGAAATLTWTPRRSGPHRFEVWAVDAVGNTSPSREYEFMVRPTEPEIDLTVAGTNLPSTLTMRSPVAEVTSFGYRIDDAAEVRVPATDATATAEVTFPRSGTYEVTVSAYVGDALSGAAKETVRVDDAPTVESADFAFPDRDGVVGREGTFTFRPRTTGVVAYHYSFLYEEPTRIAAGPDGTATLAWTPSEANWYALNVRSETADGTLSETAQYQFQVIDNRPTVYSNDLSAWPRRDGVGLPVEFSFDTGMPDVTGFVYRFNDEAEQSVDAEYGHARVTWTPSRSGGQQVTVRARFASGELGPERVWPFDIWTGPVIESAEYGPGGTGGVVDKPIAFTFRPGLPGVDHYTWSVDYGEPQTVEAGADGTATLTWTPTRSGYFTLEVTSHGADGTESQVRMFGFSVRDNRVTVYGWYHNYGPSGGIGVPGHMSFYSELFGEVVEYRYRVNDGPEQTVAASTEGTSTSLTITPDRNGENTLFVRQVLRDGTVSPVTEYVFQVGTAPLVTSQEYPRGQWSGGAGSPGRFTFSGGTAGIVEFEYQVGTDTPRTVAATDGATTVSWTPPEAGSFTMSVRGRTADGTWTDTTSYEILVQF